MKLINTFFSLIILSLFLTTCNKEEERPTSNIDYGEETLSEEFDAIPSDRYNESEIFDELQSNLNKSWKTIKNEQEGINGTIQSEVDFDFLLIKPNGIFGIIRNDSLVTTGEIIIVENTEDLFTIKFESEDDLDLLDIDILKYNNVTVLRNSLNSLRLGYGNITMFLAEEN